MDLNCPSCGAGIDPNLRFAHMVVCEHCRSAVVVDEQAARVSGKMAALTQTPSLLALGATGKLGDRDFVVLGRVRYGYERGYWDEWYIALGDETTAWIGEDEGELTLSVLNRDYTPEFTFDDVKPGMQMHLGRRAFMVQERGIAVCEGGEGQLPFEIVSGEEVPFVDLARGKHVATVEYESDGARVFMGKALHRVDVKLDAGAVSGYAGAGLDASADTVDRTTGEGDIRERIVKTGKRAKALRCFACAGALKARVGGGAEIACEYCGTVNDLAAAHIQCPMCEAEFSPPDPNVRTSVCPNCHQSLLIQGGVVQGGLGHILDDRRPTLPFRLGQRFTFEGVTYVLVGMLKFRDIEPDGAYTSYEFLLYHKDEGYRWLMMDAGHFALGVKLADGPAYMPETWKSRVRHGGRTWKVYGWGESTVAWVDGQLPWVAQVGDESAYIDAVSPPYLLSREATENEVEFFQATYLTRDEVAAAAGMSAKELPRGRGVGANQPLKLNRQRIAWAGIMALTLLVNALLAAYAWTTAGTPIATMQVSNTEYSEEFLTDPFTITEADALCEAVFHAPVANSWIALDVAVVDEQERAIGEFYPEISYYYGSSGGESWSEGSQRDSVIFKVREPGEYRFLLKGTGGVGESTVGAAATYGKPVTIHIYQGVWMRQWFVIVAALALGWLVIEIWHRAWFEHQRWGDD